MVGRLAGTLVAASALGAQAFLIPAEVHESDIKLSPFLVQPLQQEWQVIELPCSECVLPTPNTEIKDEAEGDMPMFIQGGANHLSVNVTTLMDRHAIGISGQHIIYPPLEDVNEAIVDIISSTGERSTSVKVSAESLLLGEEATDDGEVLIQIFYNIQSVDNHPVTVDPIKITAMKGTDGEISLVRSEVISTGRPAHHMAPEPPRPHRPFRPDHEIAASPFEEHKKPCTLPAILCQVREFFEDKISGHGRKAHGGCRGKKPAGSKPGRHGKHGKHDKDGDDKPEDRVGRPHRHHNKDGDKHHDEDGDDKSEDRVGRPHRHHNKDGNKHHDEDGDDKSEDRVGKPHRHHNKDGDKHRDEDGDDKSEDRVGKPHRHHNKDGDKHREHHDEDGDDKSEDRVGRPHHHHKGKDGKKEDMEDLEGVGLMAGPASEDDGRPAHHRNHHHHPGHRHHGSKAHHIVRGILMILTPVFLGITMGMAVSILGMIVGRFITFVWTRLVRGGRKGYASVQLSEEAAEKAEVEDFPPVYEDAAPAYDEKVVVVELKEEKEPSQ